MRVGKTARLVACAAYHETGHAVVAACLGLRLKTAGLHVDDKGRGIAFYLYCHPEIELTGRPEDHELALRTAHASIISFYAGLHAQRKFCNSCPEESASDDEAMASALLARISKSQMSRSSEELRQESYRCVAKSWKAIQVLARQLLREPWLQRLPECEPDSSWSGADREKRLDGQTVRSILKAQGISPKLEEAD